MGQSGVVEAVNGPVVVDAVFVAKWACVVVGDKSMLEEAWYEVAGRLVVTANGMLQGGDERGEGLGAITWPEGLGLRRCFS